MSPQFSMTIYTASTWVLPVLLAVTLHEAAHGYVAHIFGDDTAWRLGRVSFNPLSHIDPFGTVLLPALLLVLHSPFLFGYAKPVPVNFRRLRNPRRDMIWVAAAGPAMNLAMATAAALLIHGVGLLPPGIGQWCLANLGNAIVINVILAVFNMIPHSAAGRRPGRRRRVAEGARAAAGFGGALRHDDRDRRILPPADVPGADGR